MPRRVVGHFDKSCAAEAMRELLRDSDRPDAIFCANDHMAAVALDVARREFSLRVGRHLSVVGFDDASVASLSGVELTTFSQPFESMVREAVDILHELLNDADAAPTHRFVPGRLIVRRSARLPHGDRPGPSGDRRP